MNSRDQIWSITMMLMASLLLMPTQDIQGERLRLVHAQSVMGFALLGET
jgi:hypothetical protein